MEKVEDSPIAANLRVAQAKAGLTNEDLAGRVGISLRLLQKWRAGDVVPRHRNVTKLAAALGISVADLYADPESERTAA